MYQPGIRVIYIAEKHSEHPGPRAEGVQPESNGEGYSYRVKKYWVVLEVHDEWLLVQTRRGKTRRISTSDPRLRPARWWERILHSARFPDHSGKQSPAARGSHVSV